MITITVNGDDKTFENEITVIELLKACEVSSPEMVSVELNDDMLSRDQFESTTIADGDEFEFLFFMGGGQ